ncbi:MAG TPA: carbohydrate ABC transporter permease, partial [Pararhizobium sp.]|nr:carbohydrate ABC transporter permease [Pararhizobium sp.]
MEDRSLLKSVLVHLAALVLAIVVLAPLAWLFIMSISSLPDLTARPVHWWPEHVSFERYAKLLTVAQNSLGSAFLSALRNSVTVAAMATIIALAVAIPAGWSVSRNRRTGWTLYGVIATYMLPPVALAVPLFRGLAYFGLLNTVYGLAFVYLSILAPFTTWLLKSGFDSIPREIENAAMIDGARLDQTIRIIMLPPVALAVPLFRGLAYFGLLNTVY